MRRANKKHEIYSNLRFFSRLYETRLKNIVLVGVCALFIMLLNSENQLADKVNYAFNSLESWIFYVADRPSYWYSVAKKSISSNIFDEEIQQLTEENNNLKSIITIMRSEINENRHLKELLKYKIDTGYEHLSTRIIRTSIDDLGRTFLIPVGLNDKVGDGSYVTNHRGLVGKVIEVSKSFAKVQLITNRSAKTPVVFAQSRMKGILAASSLSQNFLDINYCSDLDKLIDGEYAVTSGDGLLYPYGLVIGTVRKYGNKVYVEVMYKLSDLEFVNVYYKRSH